MLFYLIGVLTVVYLLVGLGCVAYIYASSKKKGEDFNKKFSDYIASVVDNNDLTIRDYITYCVSTLNTSIAFCIHLYRNRK